MTLVGTVVRLQVQTGSLKKGVKPSRVYDPSPLLAVAGLRLTPDGAVGIAVERPGSASAADGISSFFLNMNMATSPVIVTPI